MNTSNSLNNKRWVTFTYHGSKVRKMTNVFKQTEIKIAFESTNTLQQLSKPKTHNTTNTTHDKDKSGL